jgi:hypothetical protein
MEEEHTVAPSKKISSGASHVLAIDILVAVFVSVSVSGRSTKVLADRTPVFV